MARRGSSSLKDTSRTAQGASKTITAREPHRLPSIQSTVVEDESKDTGLPLQYDNKLLIQAGRGDTSAFSRLYKEHFHAVMGFIMTRSPRDTPHLDLAQEVFLRAWKNADQFQGKCGIKTYLFGIAVNLLREQARRRRCVPQADPVSPACSYGCKICPVQSEAEIAACRHDHEKAVARRLAGMSPTLRQAVELTVRRGLPPEKAAKVAGCSIKTFQKRLERAIKTLRACL